MLFLNYFSHFSLTLSLFSFKVPSPGSARLKISGLTDIPLGEDKFRLITRSDFSVYRNVFVTLLYVRKQFSYNETSGD